MSVPANPRLRGRRAGRRRGAAGPRSAASAAAVAALLVIAPWTSMWPAGRPGVEGPSADVSFSLRPSHDRIYRAEVIATSAPVDWFSRSDWTVRVARADGSPVAMADVRASLWRLDDHNEPDPLRMRGPLSRIRVRRIDDERFRLHGVRLHGPGWWHVKLTIASPAGVDSLAFNVFQGRER